MIKSSPSYSMSSSSACTALSAAITATPQASSRANNLLFIPSSLVNSPVVLAETDTNVIGSRESWLDPFPCLRHLLWLVRWVRTLPELNRVDAESTSTFQGMPAHVTCRKQAVCSCNTVWERCSVQRLCSDDGESFTIHAQTEWVLHFVDNSHEIAGSNM